MHQALVFPQHSRQTAAAVPGLGASGKLVTLTQDGTDGRMEGAALPDEVGGNEGVSREIESRQSIQPAQGSAQVVSAEGVELAPEAPAV